MYEELSDLTETLVAIIALVAGLYITTCFARSRARVRALLRALQLLRLTGDSSSFAETEARVAFYSKWFVGYGAVGTLLYTLVPLAQRSECEERRARSLHSRHVPCGFVTRSVVPPSLQRFPFWQAIFLDQMLTCLLVSLLVLSVTALLCAFLEHAVVQLRHFKRTLLSSCEADDDEMSKEVRRCVRFHETVIEFARMIDDAFSTMMVMHLTLTSLCVSVLGFEIIMVGSVGDAVRFGLHLVGWVVLLFVTCRCGQTLIDESADVGRVAFSTRWYDASPALRRNLVLIILRSQRPLTLTATSLGVMSLEVFLKVQSMVAMSFVRLECSLLMLLFQVMSTAYSYFTLLLKVKN